MAAPVSAEARGTRRTRVALACALVAVVLPTWGCEGSGSAIPARVPEHRPGDGLLGNPALQAVVEAQVRRSTEVLVRFLGDPQPAVRARAAFALGSVQAPEAVPALLTVLSDTSAGVRRDAAFALGQVSAPPAITGLAARFAVDDDVAVRRRILQALGKIPIPQSAVVLAGLQVPEALEADRTLALAVLGAVRRISTPDGLNALLERLDDLDPRVRAAAAYYFGRVPSTESWAERVTRIRQALDGYGKGDPAAMYLVQGLGRLHDPFDRERLDEWASTASDWRTRANAMTALADQDLDADARVTLLEGLDDGSGLVAVSAAQALARARLTDPEARRVEAWIDAHAERLQVVEPLLGLLARGGERDYVLGWIDAVPAADVQRQEIGLRALAFLPGDEARLRLARAAASPAPGVAGAALEALVGRWPAEEANEAAPVFYFGIFSAALRSGNVRRMATAASALGDSTFLALGSVDTLRAALGGTPVPPDPEVAGAIRRVLSTLTGEDVPPPVEAAPDSAEAAGGPAPGTLDWAYLAELGSAPRLVLETDKGRVVVRLATEEAPQTVQTVARLAEGGRYDGVPFHRVVPNFVAQGGDFASGDGYGGPGFTIRSEFTLIRYLRGVIGMASAGKDTEGSQFFITHSMQPHLDGAYTAFGWVVEGMDAVDRLLVGDRIVRATVERGS
jgi:peptidylprolyl isomerase